MVMKCKVCASDSDYVFTQKLLQKYMCSYFFCGNCGFLQTEEPTWLHEAYSDAIACCDTGLVQRNLNNARVLAVFLFSQFGNRGCFADISGGTGLLVRLMRDIGLDYYWEDPYCQNTHAKGFELNQSLGRLNAVTGFEVLEHLTQPVEFISDLMNRTNADMFVFSTLLFDGTPPTPGKWWYYGTDTGQHISFYQVRTLKEMAEKLNLVYFSIGSLGVFARHKIRTRLSSLLVGPALRFSFPIIRRLLKSKTNSDFQLILNRIR